MFLAQVASNCLDFYLYGTAARRDNADETIRLARSVTRSRASRLIYGERRWNIFKLKRAPSAFTGLAGCPRAADKAWLRSRAFPRPGFALAGTQSKRLAATQDVHKEKESPQSRRDGLCVALLCIITTNCSCGVWQEARSRSTYL